VQVPSNIRQLARNDRKFSGSKNAASLCENKKRTRCRKKLEGDAPVAETSYCLRIMSNPQSYSRIQPKGCASPVGAIEVSILIPPHTYMPQHEKWAGVAGVARAWNLSSAISTHRREYVANWIL
jgi:hypothetical protein